MIIRGMHRSGINTSIKNFIDEFEEFDARIDERNNKAMYVKTSDRIALFAIYYRG